MTQKMTDEHRKLLRHTIGLSVMVAQNGMAEIHKYPASEIVPEILSALISLASYVSKFNIELSREEFLECCAAVADENYPKETEIAALHNYLGQRTNPMRERSFLIKGGGHIRVAAYGEPLVTGLVLSHVSSEVDFGDYVTKLAELKREWVGRTCEEWIDGKA